MKQHKRIVSWRFAYAVFAREWKIAKELLSDTSNEELYFSQPEALVPLGCLQIWLARVQGDYPRMGADFAAARDQLYRRVEAHSENSALLSVLGLIDADLGRTKEAIKEAKCAVEMLPIYKDMWDRPCLVYNLAAVYALTNKPRLAFEQSANLITNTRGNNLRRT
jgi:predicted Zn-dependent protease